MNKQELIKRIGQLLAFGSRDYIERDRVLKLVKQLDEPETGHADEAPRYVKNILARLRELPLYNREVWLKVIMSEFKQDFSHAKWREGYEQGKLEGAWVGNQLKDADKIRRELNQVKVPQFVADWYENNKDYLEYNFQDWLKHLSDYRLSKNEQFGKWVNEPENNPAETLIKMKLFGYEVEEEKRYKIEVKGVSENSVLIHDKTEECWFFEDDNNEDTIYVYHTRKELKEANFGWVFDCPGVEVEEVK